MSIELITLIFFVSIIAAIMSGFPIAITLGAVGLIIGYFTMGAPVFELMYQRGIIIALNYPLLALPLFVLMGIILADSGVADGMYNALSVILGRVRGGLAVTTVLLGAMLAACLGVITAAGVIQLALAEFTAIFWLVLAGVLFLAAITCLLPRGGYE